MVYVHKVSCTISYECGGETVQRRDSSALGAICQCIYQNLSAYGLFAFCYHLILCNEPRTARESVTLPEISECCKAIYAWQR